VQGECRKSIFRFGVVAVAAARWTAQQDKLKAGMGVKETKLVPRKGKYHKIK
jgi:hypothetical protein